MAVRRGAPVASQQSRILRADRRKVSSSKWAGKLPARVSKNRMGVYRSKWRQDWGLDNTEAETVLTGIIGGF